MGVHKIENAFSIRKLELMLIFGDSSVIWGSLLVIWGDLGVI